MTDNNKEIREQATALTLKILLGLGLLFGSAYYIHSQFSSLHGQQKVLDTKIQKDLEQSKQEAIKAKKEKENAENNQIGPGYVEVPVYPVYVPIQVGPGNL